MNWIVRDLLDLFIATPAGVVTYGFCLFFFDYFYLLPRHFVLRALDGPTARATEELPSGLLIIPSLLRGADELEAIKTTVANVVVNDYPGTLVVVVSIDGHADCPSLYADLEAWIVGMRAGLAARVWLHITGTPNRCGKPLAIEHAVQHVKGLVARGAHEEFPKIYFSTDADADLGPRALELLAKRLCKRNLFTGSPGRAVAGNLHIRGNSYWKGWRQYFTVEGQIGIQVAREYLVSNIARFNFRPLPISGITGVLYCTWTEILTEGPRFMGFMRTLNRRDWVKWWFGAAPPRFSESDVAPIPELLAGDTDDTVTAFLAIMARWDGERFTLDAPRTPVHALLYMLRTVFLDRGLRYEPEARVYTSSPTTPRALWRQRVRWNAARIEVVGRFSSSFRYHWDLGVCCASAVGLMTKAVAFGALAFLKLPLAFGKGNILLPLALGLVAQLACYTLSTLIALVLNGEVRSNWRLAYALPASVVYAPIFGFCAGATGMLKDVLLLGNCTKFAPESTLIKGGSKRIALLARVRRALVLTVRSAIYGDVPLGAFWLGWGQTEWTPSGFEGWTTGKRPTMYARLRYGAEPPAEAVGPVRRSVVEAGPMVNLGAALATRRPTLTVVRAAATAPLDAAASAEFDPRSETRAA